jgi:hypothetical protein
MHREIPSSPLCSLCNLPVILERSKTDEHGKSVHEECYALHLSLLEKQPPKSTHNKSTRNKST